MPSPRQSISLSVLSAVLGGSLLLLSPGPAFGHFRPDAQSAAPAEASAEPAADLSQGVPVESVPEADLAQSEAPQPAGQEEQEEENGPPPASAEPGADLSQGAPSEEAGSPGSAPEPAAPAEAPVSLDGQGSMLSRPFALRGGEYVVSWTAQTSNPECSLNASLHAAEDGRLVASLGGGQVFGGNASGQTALHDLPGAAYYVDAISTCRWSITISPA
jgi:hypothetical protein